MEYLPIIISSITFVFGAIAFLMARYNEAKKAGEREEKINNGFNSLRSEIDARVSSVCEKHESDMEKIELKREYLSTELHSHINDNKEEHSSLFNTINGMINSIGVIQGDVKLILSKLDEVKK